MVQLSERDERINRRNEFRDELQKLINRFSMERDGGDTPDFAIADYLMECLTALDHAIQKRKRMDRR